MTMNLKRVKSYIINLDDPPEKRWKQVINDHKEHFPKVEREIDFLLGSVGAMGGLSKTLVNLFASLGKVLYKKELKSISDMTNIPLSKLILMQICYEMCAACTSVVIQGKDRNYHFRTMDWEMDFLRDLTINVTFMKDSKELYQATTWAGYVGIATGLNKKYSLALNYRRSDGTLFGNVMRAIRMKWPVGYMIRDIFEKNLSKKDTYKALMSYKLISPCYITFCPSIGDAKVIIRDHDKTVSLKLTDKTGYLIQTNHDELESQVNIMWSFERYLKAKEIIKTFKFNENKCIDINSEAMFNKFLVKPIINEHTIYASVLIPERSYIKSYVL